MSNRTQIFIFFSLLLVFSSNTVFACGNSTVKDYPKEATCSNQDNYCKKACCDKGENKKNDCGETCSSSSCHCLGTTNIPVFQKNFELPNINNFAALYVNWTYVQHIPKEVCLSIWLPPKIS